MPISDYSIIIISIFSFYGYPIENDVSAGLSSWPSRASTKPAQELIAVAPKIRATAIVRFRMVCFIMVDHVDIYLGAKVRQKSLKSK